jgi:hypothetical protein
VNVVAGRPYFMISIKGDEKLFHQVRNFVTNLEGNRDLEAFLI